MRHPPVLGGWIIVCHRFRYPGNLRALIMVKDIKSLPTKSAPLLALIVATSHASKQVFRIDLHVASPRDSQRVDSHLISYANTSAVTNLLTSAVHELLTCIHTHAASRSRNSGYCKDLVLLNPRRWLAQVPVRVQSPLHAGHGKSPVRFAPEGQFHAHNLPDHLHPEVPPTCGRVRELNR